MAIARFKSIFWATKAIKTGLHRFSASLFSIKNLKGGTYYKNIVHAFVDSVFITDNIKLNFVKIEKQCIRRPLEARGIICVKARKLWLPEHV